MLGTNQRVLLTAPPDCNLSGLFQYLEHGKEIRTRCILALITPTNFIVEPPRAL
jgi:hypothetical protein